MSRRGPLLEKMDEVLSESFNMIQMGGFFGLWKTLTKISLFSHSLTHSPTPSGQEHQQMAQEQLDQKTKKWVQLQQQKFGDKKVKRSFVDTGKQEMTPEPEHKERHHTD
ncbi:hypothetical protein BY996DRAFT_6562712 [Phakopsora pachyrhizi]|nr:hypothetical protein BY996DRAFT_6562712 [Phakopsora pachyrhizi]